MYKNSPLIKGLPVARFFYKGSHTHPVRRTVLIIESTKTLVRGYELREGMTVRDFKNAPIKSYRRSRIAKINQIDKRRVLRREANDLSRTTLSRQRLENLVVQGA